MDVIQDTGKKLRALPRAPSTDPVGEVLQLLGDFVRDLDRRVEGTPEEDGLLQTIRPFQEAFKTVVRRTAPNFAPWDKGTKKQLPAAKFLVDEEGHGVSLMEAFRTDSVIYIDEVLKRAQE